MTKETDLAYIAGLVDGEAYIGIKKAKAYKCQGRKTPGYHARVQIRMVDEEAIKFIAENLGGWYYKEKSSSHNGRLLFCYQVSDKKAEIILRVLLPHLRVKRYNAQTVIQLRDLQADSVKNRTKIVGYRNFPNKHGTPRKVPNYALSDEYVQKCEDLYQHCKALNAGKICGLVGTQ